MRWLFLSLAQPTLRPDDSREETTTILVQALQALEFLHSQGLAHRDIKPANILVFSRNPFIIIKLSDFGLAKDIANENTLLKS